MTSSQLLFNFTANQLVYNDVSVLSIFNEKLLISSIVFFRLFIYSREGRYLSSIATQGNKLCDATWTPRGNIIYTITASNRVMVTLDSGIEILEFFANEVLQFLSVSNDDIIYLTGGNAGVYQSTDDGFSWSLVLKGVDYQHFSQVNKVTTDHSDDFWTLKYNSLYMYSKDRRHSGDMVTSRYVNVFKTNDKNMNFSLSSLSYDGNTNFFLSDLRDKAIHVLSVTGQYRCQLMSSHRITSTPLKLAVDRERQLLYVGQKNGVVAVFKLTYG